jgi:branched-chain amino acid transport system substrate-binding protein
MQKRIFLRSTALAALSLAATLASAQDNKFKIGLILPMTGPFASTGKQTRGRPRACTWRRTATPLPARRWMLIVKDDTSAPDVTKRIAQELVVNDKVNVLAGFGLTPLALATAPIATQSKTPAGGDGGGHVQHHAGVALSSCAPASPLPQVVTVGIADWAPRNGIIRTGRDPGVRLRPQASTPRKYFKDQLHCSTGATVIETLRVPMRNPDFAPFLQKVRDLKPDAMFVFCALGRRFAALMKQFAERGMDKAGIQASLATGAV